MTPSELRLRLTNLPAHLPLETALSHALKEGAGYNRAWYRSQKEHWQGWLSEYDGAGAYSRKKSAARNAQLIWNRIQCAPMLFWLAEAVEVPEDVLKTAYQNVIAAPKRNASQCRVLRQSITWQMVEMRLPPKLNFFQQLRFNFPISFGRK